MLMERIDINTIDVAKARVTDMHIIRRYNLNYLERNCHQNLFSDDKVETENLPRQTAHFGDQPSEETNVSGIKQTLSKDGRIATSPEPAPRRRVVVPPNRISETGCTAITTIKKVVGTAGATKSKDVGTATKTRRPAKELSKRKTYSLKMKEDRFIWQC